MTCFQGLQNLGQAYFLGARRPQVFQCVKLFKPRPRGPAALLPALSEQDKALIASEGALKTHQEP